MFSATGTPDGDGLSPSSKRRKLNHQVQRRYNASMDVVDLTLDDSDDGQTPSNMMVSAMANGTLIDTLSREIKTSPKQANSGASMPNDESSSKSLHFAKASNNSPQRPTSQSDCAGEFAVKRVSGRFANALNWFAGSMTPKAKNSHDSGLSNQDHFTDQGYLTPDASDHLATAEQSESSANRHTPEFTGSIHDHNHNLESVRPIRPTERTSSRDQLEKALTATMSGDIQPVMSVETTPETVVRQHLLNLREETETANKKLLQGARTSATAIPQQSRSLANSVFAKLQPLHLTQSESRAKKSAEYTVNVETKQPLGSKSIRARYVIPRTEAKVVDEHKIPRYHHFVRLQQNSLAPNITIMNCWPYFGDEHQPKEDEYENCYSIDIVNRPTKLTKLHHSQHLFHESEKMLATLKIGWADVLTFLFEQKKNLLPAGFIAPSMCVDKDFPAGSSDWQRFVGSLSTSEEALSLAAQFCEQFQRQTNLSSWHVARRSKLVREHFTQLADADLGKRECRICFRFDCHSHGELAECETHEDLEAGEGSDSEMDEATATDIVNPPRVNYRKNVAFPEVDEPVHKHITTKPDARKTTQNWSEKNFVKTHDMEPFYPCHHPGLLCNQAQCTCWKSNIMCEKYCSCSNKCDRKFRGCACGTDRSKGNKEMMCFKNTNCVCYQFGRECDPDLCGTCGICDVLDPAQPDAHKQHRGNCQNANIQLGRPKYTLLGDSTVHELGLFAAEKIKQHEFIGEYKGEIVTAEEADRRGAIYFDQRLSYLFALNQRQVVDSTYFGNKVRFINHSNSSSPTRNLYAVIMLVNTVHRIGLFAEKTINPGDELFFDYGPSFPHNQLGTEKTPKRAAPTVRNKKLLDGFKQPKVSTHTVDMPNKKSRSRSKGKAKQSNASSKRRVTTSRHSPSSSSLLPSRRQSTVLESDSEAEAIEDPEQEPEDSTTNHISAGDRLAAYYVSQDVDGISEDGDSESDETREKRKRRSSRQHGKEPDRKRRRRD